MNPNYQELTKISNSDEKTGLKFLNAKWHIYHPRIQAAMHAWVDWTGEQSKYNPTSLFDHMKTYLDFRMSELEANLELPRHKRPTFKEVLETNWHAKAALEGMREFQTVGQLGFNEFTRAANYVRQFLVTVVQMAHKRRDEMREDDPTEWNAFRSGQGAGHPKEREKTWLTKEECQQVLDSVDKSTISGCRNAALLAVLLGCGIRRAEAVRLRWANYAERETVEQSANGERFLARRMVLRSFLAKRKPTRGHSAVRDQHITNPFQPVPTLGPGQRLRTVPVPEWARHLLDEWFLRLRQEGVDNITEPNYCIFGRVRKSKRGEEYIVPEEFRVEVNLATVNSWIKEIMGSSGLKRAAGMTTHDWRRTSARLWWLSGADLEQVQQQLGHSNLQTTQIYLGLKQEMGPGKSVVDRVEMQVGQNGKEGTK